MAPYWTKVFFLLSIGCSVTSLLTKGLLVCLKPQKVTVYVETSLYLLHIADPIQVKYKGFLESFVKENKGEIEDGDYDPTVKSCISITFCKLHKFTNCDCKCK